MSDRLVKAASAPRQGPPIATAENNTSGGATMGNGDSYVSRVAKYIPSEVLAFYVGASGLVASWDQTDGATRTAWWLIFAIGLVGTPAYLLKLSKLKTPWSMHALISSVAFVIWAYTLGGPFKLMANYSPQFGSLGLVVFTFAAGMLSPKENAA